MDFGKEERFINYEAITDYHYTSCEKSTEYNLRKKLIIKREFKFGKINGKGKEYTYDRKLIFEGEYLGQKKWKKRI